MKQLLLAALLLTQGLPLAQTRNGTIVGQLLTREGAPAANTRVAAMAVSDSPALASDAMMLSIAQTDASGRYRLENVPPGRYYIAAGFVDVPTYYPGVSAIANAAVVTVATGTVVQGIDFAAVVPSSLRISGRVIWPNAPSAMRTGTRANQVRLTGGSIRPAQVVNIAPDGSFEFLNVRPGSYALVVGYVQMEPIPIVLFDKDITGVELTVIDVSGTVVVEGGGLQPLFLLRFTDTRMSGVGADHSVTAVAAAVVGTAGLPTQQTTAGSVAAAANGTLTGELGEGEYRIGVTGLPSGYVIKSIVSGSTDLLRDPLKVSKKEGPKPIVVTLGVSSPWVKVSGRVVGGEISSGTARVRLIDTTVTRARAEAVINPDGSFEFPMIMPGTYFAVVLPPSAPSSETTIVVPDRDIADVEIALPAMKEVSGRALVEDGAPPTQPSTGMFLSAPMVRFALSLSNAEGMGAPIKTVLPQADASFKVNLPIGEWRLLVIPEMLPAGYAVRSFTYGDTDLLRNPLKIAPTDLSEFRIVFEAKR